MIKVKTILVPTDFSDCSDAAVKYGYALAEAFGATIHLLNVVQDPYTMPWSADACHEAGEPAIIAIFSSVSSPITNSLWG